VQYLRFTYSLWFIQVQNFLHAVSSVQPSSCSLEGAVFYLHKLGVGDKPASDILFSNQYLLIGLLLDLGELVGLLLEKEIKVKSV
jgi:hypothetical protein